MGAGVVLLEGPGDVDVAALVRDAFDRGADLLGVAVRRYHDTNHSGWWVLCPIMNIVFLFFAVV